MIKATDSSGRRTSVSGKPLRAFTPTTLFQTSYLTIKHFLKNRMMSYAGACSFSFLFSFIPVFMLIAIVLARILHASTDSISQALKALPDLHEYVSTDTIIKIASHSGTNATFEILLTFFIFWMARRFFASIFDSVQCIFHTREQRKALIKQVLTLAVEVAVIIAAAVIIFLYVSLRTVIILPVFNVIQAHFPRLTALLTQQYLVQAPNILLLLLVTAIYRISSGTKPQLKLCLLAAFLCTGSFWLFRYVLHLFLNTASYNLIYGVLGRLIILLLDIFFFFVIFLFCAVLVFTMQFFDLLLLEELYLLPDENCRGFSNAIRRKLFIHPDFLLAKDGRTIRLSPGSAIYRHGDKDTAAYYIAKGFIQLKKPDSSQEPITYIPGTFFGEISCMIQRQRSSDAVAVTDAEIIRIESETFKALLLQSPEAVQKTLASISKWFS